MADTTVPGNVRPLILEDRRVVTSRGKAESALLIVLMGVAAAATTIDSRFTQSPTIYETRVAISRSKVFPLISILTSTPNDIVHGWDNFVGWPEPEPTFVKPPFTAATISILTSYAAYNPATDVIYPQFRRKPVWIDSELFDKPWRANPLATINVFPPPPAGDLTTLLRHPAQFFESESFIQPQKAAWFIALMPQLSPGPPVPPVDMGRPWPPASAITNLPGRGGWVLPGSSQALCVFGNGCYLMTVASPATASTYATFAIKRVGSLATNTGPVSIRDNGPGGYAVLVDGPNGYLYNIASQGFAKITDPEFEGGDTVAFIDGWWIFNIPGTQEFYTPAQQYGTVFNASNFALKDGATDKLVSLIENKEELWLIGERTTEIWYDAGGTYFAFARLVSTMLQVGCSAKYSVARYQAGGDSGMLWLGKSERGENVVLQTKGFQADAISTPAIANLISSFHVVDDATAYVYEEQGHEFYVLTFPTADRTLVYDLTTQLWHERASFDATTGLFHRHRSTFFINFQNQRLVGDYQNGSVYRMDRKIYQDHIWPMVALRATPHIWDGDARQRVFMANLQLQFSPGVGRQSGRGYDPQALLRISRDAGTTWGARIARTLGKVGQYLHRVIWRRMSFARDSVIEVRVIDPVNRDVVGATLKDAAGEG